MHLVHNIEMIVLKSPFVAHLHQDRVDDVQISSLWCWIDRERRLRALKARPTYSIEPKCDRDI